MKHKIKSTGFTLIELLVVIGIIAILAGVVIVALNPGRQFAQARNTQRWSNVNTILNAISQNQVDNKGNFTCAIGGVLPTSTREIGTSFYNIETCIVPTYVSTMPVDPTNGTASSTRYTVVYDPATRRVTVASPDTELTPETPIISVTR